MRGGRRDSRRSIERRGLGTFARYAAGPALLGALAAPILAAEPAPVAPQIEVRLRERASTRAFRRPLAGRYAISVAGTVDPQLAEAIRVRVGAAEYDLPLRDGAFAGRVAGQPGRVRAHARLRSGRVRCRITGRSAGGAGFVFGERVLAACRDVQSWNGPVFGLTTGALGLDGTEIPLAIGVAARADWLPRPRWLLDPMDTNDRYAVRVQGVGVSEARLSAGPAVQLAPRRSLLPWRGRVVGHALARGAAVRVTRRIDDRAARDAPPDPAEALDFVAHEQSGDAASAAPADRAALGALTVVHRRFDIAVPVPPGAHRIRLRAEDEFGAGRTVHLDVAVDAPAPPVRFDLGVQTLEIRDDGRVWAWGENVAGEVGDGTARKPISPVPLGTVPSPRCVAAGDAFSVAVDEHGRVWRWGAWESSRDGVDRDIGSRVPEIVPGLEDVEEAAAGDGHLLALDARGRVWALGRNDLGQLGDGSRVDRPRRAVRVQGLPHVRNIAAGWEYSLALDGEGRLWAWGDHRRLGETANLTAALVDVPRRVARIDARGVPLALAADGTVWTWGANEDGELGDGTTTLRMEPVPVAGLPSVIAVSSGDFHCMALAADGTAWGWGQNGAGELGDGTSVDRLVPVRVRDLGNLVAVGAGTFRSLAVDSRGLVWAWGSYDFGAGTVGWRSGNAGTLPVLAERDFKPGHFVVVYRPFQTPR